MSSAEQSAAPPGDASDRDPLNRFSSRVADYVRARPGYPDELYTFLQQHAGLTRTATVADVGSGTGIFTAQLLERAVLVYGVEPNREMRQAAEAQFAGRPSFHSVEGTAEATGLADHSVDLVTAAQAFHWFNPQRFRAESLRILKPGGHAALVWNSRREGGTPFLDAYEALLMDFGTDYRQVKQQHHEKVDNNAIYFNGGFQRKTFSNSQVLDFEGLKSRLLSSSYVPREDSPRFGDMLRELEHVFQQHSQGGTVTVEYELELFYGVL